ncbi:MAG: acyltransferase [Smithella sp.]
MKKVAVGSKMTGVRDLLLRAGIFRRNGGVTMGIKISLDKIEDIIQTGLDEKGTAEILMLMGVQNFPLQTLAELRLFNEVVPKITEYGLTDSQRYLHFLWDTLDKSPISINIDFAIPLRRIIARALFKKCGKNFIAEENCRFNFGQGIGIGDDVFFNRGVYIDSKGGVEIGNGVGITENVQIFTHSHSESDHEIRSYAKVTIGNYALVFSGSTILPGVTIGDGAIISAKSVVAHDVQPGMVVSGAPAQVVRKRHTDGRRYSELNHVWLANSAFQDE